MGGASNSGIPADNLSRSWSIDLVIHSFISGSLFLHGFMYDAAPFELLNRLIIQLFLGQWYSWQRELEVRKRENSRDGFGGRTRMKLGNLKRNRKIMMNFVEVNAILNEDECSLSFMVN